MKNPLHKLTYKGHGIYWHGGNKYGDETQVIGYSLAFCKMRIDEREAKERAQRPAHLKYWDTLTADQRDRWRKLCQTTELSASELAYTNRKD